MSMTSHTHEYSDKPLPERINFIQQYSGDFRKNRFFREITGVDGQLHESEVSLRIFTNRDWNMNTERTLLGIFRVFQIQTLMNPPVARIHSDQAIHPQINSQTVIITHNIRLTSNSSP